MLPNRSKVISAYRKCCRMRLRSIISFIIFFSVFALSCSLPSLESANCSNARESVRRFYSFHLGNDTAFTPETLEKRRGFLTSSFFVSLSMSQLSGDPFTRSETPPKTFKIADCKENQNGTAEIRVQVYWKDDLSTVQSEFFVAAKSIDGNWLIDRIY